MNSVSKDEGRFVFERAVGEKKDPDTWDIQLNPHMRDNYDVSLVGVG